MESWSAFGTTFRALFTFKAFGHASVFRAKFLDLPIRSGILWKTQTEGDNQDDAEKRRKPHWESCREGRNKIEYERRFSYKFCLIMKQILTIGREIWYWIE